MPFLLKITNMSNFNKFFKFNQTIQQNDILPNTDYLSQYIPEIVKPLSVIEWHCNIAEYNYSNHDNHSHLHKHELLHINFIDNNFYENPVYKETSRKIMFIFLREGLQEIREIILTPVIENGEEITILKNAVVYLQLKEE